MKKVLILEDNFELNRCLAQVVSSQGLSTIQAYSLSECYQLMETAQIELFILDRKLPDGDSIELVEYICESYPQSKVLFLSQLSDVSDRISAYKLGADDYLAKPFSLKEVSLKIAILLHRSKTKSSELLSAGNIRLDPNTFELHISELKIQLRKKEAEILACLIRHRNAVVTRATVISHVWGYDDFIPTNTTLDVYIRKIRLQIKKSNTRIKTIRATGYVLAETSKGK